MPTTPALTFGAGRVDPYKDPDDARLDPLNLQASTTFAAGTIVGEVAATPGTYGPYSSATLAAPTVAPAPTAVGTGGTFAAGAYNVNYAYRTAGGSTTLSPTATVTLVANGSISVAALTLPAGVTSVDWYVSTAPADTTVQFSTNNTGGAFTITAPPAPGSGDPPTANTAYTGIFNPTHVLQYACQTDALGNITLGTGTAGGEWGVTYKSAPGYRSGYFNCGDLVGLDATAVARLGRLLEGTVTNGRVLIYGS